MQVEIGLTLALISAVAVNWAYSREHDAAAGMPRFSARRPRQFLTSLLGDRQWVTAFGTETAGWLVYVAALRLAPLSLVQAVGASGIAVLALATARGHPGRLARREQIAVMVAIAGLVLLSLSLVNTEQPDQTPDWAAVAIWLGCTVGAALILAIARPRLARGPALGLAAGLLFAGGDISAKLITYGGALAARAPEPHRLLRPRHEPPTGGLPAQQRADSRRARDARIECRAHRRGIRRLRGAAPRRHERRAAGRGVQLARRQRHPARRGRRGSSSGADFVE